MLNSDYQANDDSQRLSICSMDNQTLTPQQEIAQLKRILELNDKALQVQQTLYKIANIPFGDKDLHAFFKDLHQVISHIIDTKNFFIALYEDAQRSISFPYFVDTVDSIDRQYLTAIPSEQLHQTLTGYVLRTSSPLLTNKEQMQSLFDQGEVTKLGKASHSWLGIPLFSGDQVAGVMVVQSYSPKLIYSESDKELMVYVAKHVDIALDRKNTADGLLQANVELQAIKDDLEKRVEKRTTDLSQVNLKLKKLLDDKDKIQKKLAFGALHDALTGLPNRVLFMDRLLTAISRRHSREKLHFAVLFLDLDRFKVINDSLGHLVGDLLLKEVSNRISETLRPCDSVARFGGDEFCVLLEGNIATEDASAIAERLVQLISSRYDIQGHEVYTSPSIGIALDRESYLNPEEVLRDADAAMYQAKANGKATFEFFNNEMHQYAMLRLQLERELRTAVFEHQLTVHFQPIFHLGSKKIKGFEALVRWHHQELGVISPIDFVSIAEEIGVINELGDFVLKQSLEDFEKWTLLDRDFENLFISVNLSPKQLEQDNLVNRVTELIEQSNLYANNIKLEITENCLVNNFENAKQVLTDFSDMGIGISLDDFGTGFSSLSYLHHFPISTLKVDRSFINNMFLEKTDMAIIKTVEGLARSLDIDVIAEGIETERQFQKLRLLNINSGQGYLYSKPVSAEAVTEKLKTLGLLWSENSTE